MLELLTNIAAILSGPRYRPEIEWSNKCWTHNAFRFFELLFGRKYGLRVESTVAWERDPEGNMTVVHNFHTVEALLAHAEGVVRGALKGFKLVKVYVPALQLAPAGFPFQRVQSPYFLAIAYDAAITSTAVNSTSCTYALTTSGSDRALIEGHNTQGGDLTTGVTYNSAALTFETKSNGDGAPAGWYGYNYVYWKTAPSTGANNVVISASGSGWMRGGATNFTGCDQTDPVENIGVTNATSTQCRVTITVGESNCWLWIWNMYDNASPATVTEFNCTVRSEVDARVCDSTTTVSTGSNTAGADNTSSQRATTFCASIRPPSASGPANLKSYDGNVKANIKSIMGNLIANVKSLSGNA